MIFSDNFDSSPDWHSAESYSSRANAVWPATWSRNPDGAATPPPKGWTSYRASIPRRGGHAPTFVLGPEGARNPGGKGITCNIEATSYGDWVGGGLDLYLGDRGYQELYVRFYLKYDPNTFHWGTAVPNFALQKLARISRLKVPPSARNSPQYFLGKDSAQMPTFYPDIMNNPAYNKPPEFHPAHLNVTEVTDPMAVSSQDLWKVPWPSDGKWHCYEFRVKMNTAPGVADGEWEVWIDGSRKRDKHFLKKKVAWVQGGSRVQPGWNWVTVLDNSTIQPDPPYAKGVMKVFLDDVAIGTSYIGPDGTGGVAAR